MSKTIETVNNKKRPAKLTESNRAEKRLTTKENKSKLTVRLSKVQRDVLVYLFEGVRQREDYFLSVDREKRDDPGCGFSATWWNPASGGMGCRPSIPWYLICFLGRSPTRSESASFSRVIRRLAARQLIEIYTEWSDGSKHHANVADVTDLGRAAACELSGVTDPFPTLDDYLLAQNPGKTLKEIKKQRERQLQAFHRKEVKW